MVISLLLIGLAAATAVLAIRLVNTNESIAEVESDLAASEADLAETRSELATTEAELRDTEADLAASDDEISSLYSTIASLEQSQTAAGLTARQWGELYAYSDGMIDAAALIWDPDFSESWYMMPYSEGQLDGLEILNDVFGYGY